MAEDFGDVVKKLGSAVKKPAAAKAPAVLAVQIVDSGGKVIKEEKGAAAAEEQREKEKREKKTITLLQAIADGIGGRGGKGEIGGKGRFNWKKIFGNISLGSIGLAAIALAALSGVKKAILGALGLVIKGPLFVLKTALKLAKGVLGPIARAASGFIKGGLTKAFATVADWGHKGATAMKNIATKASGFIKDGLTSAYKNVAKWGHKGATAMKSIATNASGFIKDGLSKAYKNVAQWGLKGATALKGVASSASTFIQGALKTAWKAPKDVAKWGLKAFVNLKNIATTGAKTVAGAIQGVLPGITGVAKVGAGGKGMAGAAKLGKLMLRGAKFIPGAGLAVTGAIALYDGLTAGMQEFKKSGDLSKAIKEGTAGALSGITFGLVSQKTFSDAFTTISDKYTSLTTDVSKLATKAWTGVKDKLPTKDQIEKTFNSLAKGFTNITGITVPTFSDIEKKISSVGDKLKASFSGIMDKANNFFTKTTDWFKGLFAAKPQNEKTVAELQEELREHGERAGFGPRTVREGRQTKMAALRKQIEELIKQNEKTKALDEKFKNRALKPGSIFTHDQGIYDRLDKIIGSGPRRADVATAINERGIQRDMGGAAGGGGITSINTGGNVVSSPTTNYVNNGIAARRPILMTVPTALT